MRTEKWARSKGLVYTGISDRSQGTCEVRCKELRDKGYTAFVVSWEKNPLSRGSSGGYSVFADKQWVLDQEEACITKELKELPGLRDYYHAQLALHLKQLNEREAESISQLAGLRVRQMGGPW